MLTSLHRLSLYLLNNKDLPPTCSAVAHCSVYSLYVLATCASPCSLQYAGRTLVVFKI